jgi:DNA-binding transcriptional regulator/RsmH inhibitor MraZ
MISGRRMTISLLTAGLLLAGGRTARAGSLDEAIEATARAITAAAKSQKRVDATSDETANLITEYRAALEQIESLKAYNAQVERLVAAQNAEVESLRQQIDNATTIAREITPLMLRMLDSLEQFVELDVPFLLAERRERIATLREIMGRADVTDAEKYRRIVEAYQVENEYGRTVEAYTGPLAGDAEGRTVNFLRVGRVVLTYETLDGQEVGGWDPKSKSFVTLPTAYRSAIRKGIRMARKQAAPDLMRLPVSAPEVAQ